MAANTTAPKTPAFLLDSSTGHEDYRAGTTDEPGFDGLILILEPMDDAKSNRTPCRCGCRIRCNNPESVFLPGHDARLAGKLIRAERLGVDVTIISGELATSGDAESTATRLFVTEGGVDKVRRGIAARQPKAAPATEDGSVKVGRWFYEAARNTATGEVIWTDRQGAQHQADTKVADSFQAASA